MTFDTTRLHKMKLDSKKSRFRQQQIKILTKSLRISPISARIQNMRLTNLESTSKIIVVDVDNYSFGYNLITETWISDGCSPVARGTTDF